MSSIKCKECGKRIPEQATHCPNCGYCRKQPHSYTLYTKKNNNKYMFKRKSSKKQYLYYFLAVVAAFSFFFIINRNSMNLPGITTSDNLPGRPVNEYSETFNSTINRNESNMFIIENVEITNIIDKQLWREIEFNFDFMGSPSADSYRDGSGKLILEVFAESYNPDGTIEVSQTYTVNVTGDNRYSGSITSFDTELVKGKIISITFSIFGSFDSSNSVVINL